MRIRMNRLVAIAAAAAVVLLAPVAGAGEVQTRAVPKPVMDAAKGRFKTAKYVGAAKEKNEAGEWMYEVSMSEKGMGIDMMVTPAGAITLIEKQIARKDLPQAMADTLNARYPKAKYQIFEQVYTVVDGKETLAYYETMLVDPHKQTWAVELALDGSVRKIENKTGETD
jgi:hypothetical protein